VTKRQEFGNRVSSVLSNAEGLAVPNLGPDYTSVFAQYTILTDYRETIQVQLKEQVIPSVSYYSVPLHLQPVFAHLGCHPGDFPIGESIAGQCLSLPISPYLSKGDQDQVIENIIQSLTT
jgi:UDP-2-acetamido-2-deoxy-ribo-hexuluronate aminotransferase